MNMNIRNLFFVLVILLMISCAIGGSTGSEKETPDLQATSQAQQATIIALQNQQTAAPPTPPPAIESTEGTTSGNAGSTSAFDINTNFGSNDGYFSLLNNMKIENGSMFLGKFEKCADFSLELDKSQGCLTLCKTCGEVSDYETRFEITYDSGRTDQPVGFALRFIDKAGNKLIDREDYFLGWVFSFYPGEPWSIWEHVPGDYAGWHVLKQGDPNLRSKLTEPNIFRIISFNNGQRIALYMNDVILFKIQNEDPEKTDQFFYMKNMPNSGLVGIWVAAHDIKIKVDNFALTHSSSQPNDW